MNIRHFDDFLEAFNVTISCYAARPENVPKEYVEAHLTTNFHVVEMVNVKSNASEKFFVALPTGMQHWNALMKNNPQNYICGVLANLMNQVSSFYIEDEYAKNFFGSRIAIDKKDYDRLAKFFNAYFGNFLHELYLRKASPLLCLALCRLPDTNKETIVMMLEDSDKTIGELVISEQAAKHPKLKDLLPFC